MKDLNIGSIIPDGLQNDRDAIHVAVVPILAGEFLSPGTHVGFQDALRTHVLAVQSQAGIGIVDPFLKRGVEPGERFWLFLYPGTITSLRHNWTHPAFAEEAKPPAQDDVKAKAEAWLKDFAEDMDIGYNKLLDTLRIAAVDGDYRVCFDVDTPDRAFQDNVPMWKCFEILTGIQPKELVVPFTCAC